MRIAICRVERSGPGAVTVARTTLCHKAKESLRVGLDGLVFTLIFIQYSLKQITLSQADSHREIHRVKFCFKKDVKYICNADS